MLKRVAVLLALVMVLESRPVRGRFEYESLEAEFEVSDSRFYLKMKSELVESKEMLAFAFMNEKGLMCPGFGYTFNKATENRPALSMAGACEAGEAEPKIRYGISGDWQRTVDSVEEGVWSFEGTRENFEEGLEAFGVREAKQVRVLMVGRATTESGDSKRAIREKVVNIEWK